MGPWGGCCGVHCWYVVPANLCGYRWVARLGDCSWYCLMYGGGVGRGLACCGNCADGAMGEKYISMVAWDRRWRDLVKRAVWASGGGGGMGSCEEG